MEDMEEEEEEEDEDDEEDDDEEEGGGGGSSRRRQNQRRGRGRGRGINRGRGRGRERGVAQGQENVLTEYGAVVPRATWDVLHDYQRLGCGWLWALHEGGHGGILGDEYVPSLPFSLSFSFFFFLSFALSVSSRPYSLLYTPLPSP